MDSFKTQTEDTVLEVGSAVASDVGGDMTGRSHQRTFWTEVNVLYLDLDDGYAGVSTVNICALFFSM